MLQYFCVVENIFIDDDQAVDGAGIYQGQKVHLVDSGPAHSDYIAHPLTLKEAVVE